MKRGLLWSLSAAWLFTMFTTAAADPPAALGADYRIDAGDVLLIRVWNDPRLDGPVTVDKDGAITFPMIGRVSAKGLTANDLAQSLIKRLADGYILQPHVTVVVLHGRPTALYILGEVRRPGVIQVRGDTGFGQALAMAGGLTPASDRSAVVMRPDTSKESGQTVLNVDVAALLAGKAEQNVILKPGDTVVFPAAVPSGEARAFIFGEAREPGVISLDKSPTLIEAVAAAGGGTENSEDFVVLLRAPAARGEDETPSRQFDLQAIATGRAGRDVALRHGDIVYFPRRRARVVYVLGQVVRPGAYEWKPDMNVFHAIMEAGGFTRNANREAITISRISGARVQQVRAEGTTPVQADDVIRVSEGLF